MIVDATCAPSNIRYPQDVSLLNEARENAETLLDVLHDPADGKKPRTYRKRARKDYLKYTRCRKHTAKMTRKAIGKQLAYLRRDLDAIDGKLSLGKNLPPRQTERLGTIRAVYEQQKYMYDNRTHSVPDRIVSVSQPFVRPIVRGKAGKPVEFGAKLDISVIDGWTRLECCSFDAYNEAGNLREMAERFRAREGHYPSRILADKIYRNRENLSYCKAHGIRLSGPALGRPKKGETRDKAQNKNWALVQWTFIDVQKSKTLHTNSPIRKKFQLFSLITFISRKSTYFTIVVKKFPYRSLLCYPSATFGTT